MLFHVYWDGGMSLGGKGIVNEVSWSGCFGKNNLLSAG